MSRQIAWNWLLSWDRKQYDNVQMCHNNIICKLLSLSLSFLQWQSYNTSTCIVNLPKASKSLLLIAASISLILCGTIMSALCCSRDQVHHREKKKWGCTLSRELVWTVVLIPRVLLTDFFWSLTTSMITWSSGQCVWGATCIAKLSDPSSLSPLSHQLITVSHTASEWGQWRV